MQYLIDLADQGITHNIPDLRERVQQLLNLIPSGKNPTIIWLFMYSIFILSKIIVWPLNTYRYILYLCVICFIDTETVGNIKNICRTSSENSSKTPSLLDAMFFTSSSTQVLYNLEVSVNKSMHCIMLASDMLADV